MPEARMRVAALLLWLVVLVWLAAAWLTTIRQVRSRIAVSHHAARMGSLWEVDGHFRVGPGSG